MEELNINSESTLVGIKVKNFPNGIGAAFDRLEKMFSDNRNYYGISYGDSSNMLVYIAATEERNAGEAEKYNLERFKISAGSYRTATLRNWRQHTTKIKDVLHELMDGQCASESHPCIEWYKDNDEMVCMFKSDQLHE